MPELTVALAQRSYPISIQSGLLGTAMKPAASGHGAVLIVTDSHVGPLYAERLKQCIGRPDCPVWSMPAGEQEKNLARFAELLEFLAERKLTRDSCILALGGGVVGDLAGFAAACYMRGIAFIQVPTTLLAMVDSSVGGKTAVDLPAGKNLAGAFHQPKAVWIDPEVLITLPGREYKAGLAEVVKAGAIAGEEFFAWLEKHADALNAKRPDIVEQAIARSCRLKADIVARDETEQGDRALLNFGHTFGHALEVLLEYGSLVHGEAVAIGMALAADYSAQLGLAGQADADRLKGLIHAFGLPTQLPPGLNAAQIVEKMRLDKKALHGELRLVLWRGIGACYVHANASGDDVLRFLDQRPRPVAKISAGD
jgi:3-dehydroquinate synthase